ncbi:MAG: phosphoribosylformylglycinamidine synthase [Negativicutes bacterium]|nr:phosphoribosylformylglycinamidine synthase [Negativicutes bacterium]
MLVTTVRRIYVEKKSGFDIEAQGLLDDLRANLDIRGLTKVRLVNRYDIAGISGEVYRQARGTVFAEPPVDLIYDEELPVSPGARVFAMEYLPGQYDQRADWAAQCIQVIAAEDRPEVATAKLVILEGCISDSEFARIKSYLINPVEAREASLDKPDKLNCDWPEPANVKEITGFCGKTEEELRRLMANMGLAMSFEDLLFCQEYFCNTEKREPTVTEIRAIDTYWSDHCRHTTFLTEIQDVAIENGTFTAPVANAYRQYLAAREAVYGHDAKAMSLMDIATIAMKQARLEGRLADLDASDEVNACSIVVDVDVNGKNEEWLVMFKNETHNHPTEIEPFGGAATCLGGAIRDPLSGRSYVYQAMRVTGSGDPRARVEETLPGKLPQRTITTLAAAGYSAYGNQVGLATGQVAEVYDQDFIAKRMEIGAVIAAAPRRNVVRVTPQPGDVVILVGGRTGRDGIGGATGSSKEHTEESLATCGAEVQKGNPPTERKIQRLFRRAEASRLIKRCNDFGAGGVSVAIGELADGVEINLDAIPKKYEGLDGTELALSESQERMAVVVAAADAPRFQELAAEENLEATIVAQVTAEARLRMKWRGRPIVDISREFLNTNGCRQFAAVLVKKPDEASAYFDRIPKLAAAALPDIKQAWLANLEELNHCSQKGLVERFDSTIGAGTVLLPFGGRYQQTPAEGMVAKLPVLEGETNTATIMTYGYNPQLAKWSPFHGALYAVVEAVAKVVALGGSRQKVRLTLQEYFEKLGKDKNRWGKPFSALLGAYYAQTALGTPAIGGKDSMSGTYKDMHVPPTLVAFAVAVTDSRRIVSPEFKQPGSQVVYLPVERDGSGMPDFAALNKTFDTVAGLIDRKLVFASSTVRSGGIALAVSRMAFGNRIGMAFSRPMTEAELFAPQPGAFILEMPAGADVERELAGTVYQVLGTTVQEAHILINGTTITLEEAVAAWEKPLEKVFPTRAKQADGKPCSMTYTGGTNTKRAVPFAKPRVFIPVFPGTNCEYDSAKAFARAGGIVETVVVRNYSAAAIEASVAAIAAKIKNSQIIMLPGGFSAGDEPDGSGKFIAAVFRNPRIKEAIAAFLACQDGLMLGICNGFQALIKLGLLPYGEIRDLDDNSPTLTYNVIGRHVSTMVRTKIVSNLSPWLSLTQVGDVHTVPVSHGEGRFVATAAQLGQLFRNGQVAAQYVDFDGNPSYDIRFNPNGSLEAIEAITSPDGRILGKMAHSERIGANVGINVPGEKDQRIFEAGVKYFQ